MMHAVPPGYRLYAAVVSRLAPVRPAGGGLTFQCPFPGRHRHGDANWSGRCWVSDADGALMVRCMGCGATWREIAREIGVPHTECWPNKGKRPMDPTVKHPPPRLVATHQYRDRDGVLLWEKQRFEPGFYGAKKSFLSRRPLPAEFCRRMVKEDGLPAGTVPWVYGLTAGQYGRPAKPGHWDFREFDEAKHQHWVDLPVVEPVLYRLPDLLAADPRQPAVVVEGEKDADQLWSLGFVATCGHAGSSTWLDHWAPALAGRRVVVVPDHHHVGYAHAEKVAGSVMRAGAASVRLVSWDHDGLYDPGEGGGLGNWLARVAPGQDAAALRRCVIDLCRRCPEYARPVPAPTPTEAAA